jgi:hypothetical protein
MEVVASVLACIAFQIHRSYTDTLAALTSGLDKTAAALALLRGGQIAFRTGRSGRSIRERYKTASDDLVQSRLKSILLKTHLKRLESYRSASSVRNAELGRNLDYAWEMWDVSNATIKRYGNAADLEFKQKVWLAVKGSERMDERLCKIYDIVIRASVSETL